VIFDLGTFEWHNIARTSRGLRTRRALVAVSTLFPNAVGGFTVEAASTTEPWHYILTQSTAGRVTLTVTNESFATVYTQDLGVMQANPVVSWGVVNNQLMVNSPSFSAPLYGLPGGGLITAIKSASINPDTTALDIPAGHIAAFGDRFVIAKGNALLFNDPPTSQSVDPRTFVAANIVTMPGTIYDVFQGPDGALYVFTSGGSYMLPSDAIGQGQSPVGFFQRIAGISVSRPRNAVAAAGVVAVLQRDHVLLLPSRTKIDLAPKGNRHRIASITEIDDMRLAGELYATPTGFVVGFRGKRGYFIDVNTAETTVSYVSDNSTALNIVGTLRTRDGDVAYVFPSAISTPFQRCRFEDPLLLGSTDTVNGCLIGRIPLKMGDRPLISSISVNADNVGHDVQVDLDGKTATRTVPTRTGDVVAGTSTWGGTTTFAGRSMRSVRLAFAAKTADPHIELVVQGGDFSLTSDADAELAGQGRQRRDAA
jgi:hypothetical protein